MIETLPIMTPGVCASKNARTPKHSMKTSTDSIGTAMILLKTNPMRARRGCLCLEMAKAPRVIIPMNKI